MVKLSGCDFASAIRISAANAGCVKLILIPKTRAAQATRHRVYETRIVSSSDRFLCRHHNSFGAGATQAAGPVETRGVELNTKETVASRPHFEHRPRSSSQLSFVLRQYIGVLCI